MYRKVLSGGKRVDERPGPSLVPIEIWWDIWIDKSEGFQKEVDGERVGATVILANE